MLVQVSEYGIYITNGVIQVYNIPVIYHRKRWSDKKIVITVEGGGQVNWNILLYIFFRWASGITKAEDAAVFFINIPSYIIWNYDF
jgi:hypothetical protein